MIPVSIGREIKEKVPDLKVGVIVYQDIVVDQSPQMISSQLDYFQEELAVRLADQSYGDIPGLSEWRKTFKKLGTNPSRYRPSAESLYRRVKKGNKLPAIHSAADLNNYFSLKYEIPLGIYDLDQIDGPVEIRVGTDADQYEGLNGRDMKMKGKLLSADQKGAFGSPIVDSKRTMTTETTKNAIQIVYLKPSMDKEEAELLMKEMSGAFEQIHGGTSQSVILYE